MAWSRYPGKNRACLKYHEDSARRAGYPVPEVLIWVYIAKLEEPVELIKLLLSPFMPRILPDTHAILFFHN